MAFTENDRRNLTAARNVVAELEAQEREALSGVGQVLRNAGLLLDGGYDWADVVQHADVIRDVLRPFDSGVREALSGT